MNQTFSTLLCTQMMALQLLPFSVFLAICSSTTPVLAGELQLQIPQKLPVPRKSVPQTNVPDELLVMASGTSDRKDFQDSLQAVHGEIIRTIGSGSRAVYVVRTEKGKIEDTEKKLRKNENIAMVQRNYMVQMQQKSSYVPNDPYFSSQWHIGGVNAQAAWSSSTGQGMTVAIVDSGVPVNGVDISGKVRLNGVAVKGYDAVQMVASQGPTGDHGAMTATTACAVTNNRTNTAGVAPAASIYPIKVSDSSGRITESAILEAIDHAGSKGIKILNVSLNASPPYSLSNRSAHPVFHAYADWYHSQVGGLIFLAAGNDAREDASPISPNLIVVSAISPSYRMASFSTYGSNLWFTGPGESIVCTNASGRVASVAGTSFSTPCLAGVAALVWAVNPQLKNTDVERILVSTCYRASSGASYTKYFGYGMPNAKAAVSAARNASSR